MAFTFYRIPVGICNSFLLRGDRTILIDGGAMGGFPAFQRQLKALNVDPKEIELILLTHGGLDGFETCRRIRARPGMEWLPVLMLTGLGDEASVTRAVDA